jgi:uncharacterized RDD family membrane protein YckC
MTEPTDPTEPSPSPQPSQPTAPALPAVPAPPTSEPAATTSWTAPEPTPGPAPGVEFAEPGARLIAYIIDVLIITGVTILLVIIGAVFLVILPIISVFFWLGAVLFGLAYFPYFWAKDGQTIGNRQMRIRVVRDVDGGPVSMGSAILRLVGYWISGAVFYIGYIWIFVDQRRRGWMDLIAGTVVVKA